uniref:Major facilitator superfamily (MFS) profile domain-containing protein n=2 Tax=Spongospora subterranea TaxID=70186 RepID=A0A0H5R443_9EUKA|eukprot:CRZ02784.1 hypothetical protein [Spongospora subterranea]
MFIPMLFGALLSSSLSGYISDRLGGRRKIIVYWSGAVMAISCLMLTITRSYSGSLFVGGLFGLGYGAFTAVDWALVTDLLEDNAEFAKDMAVWGIALVLPNLVMPLVGRLLDWLQQMAPSYNIGYSIVFLIAAAEFAGGSYFVKYIYKIK